MKTSLRGWIVASKGLLAPLAALALLLVVAVVLPRLTDAERVLLSVAARQDTVVPPEKRSGSDPARTEPAASAISGAQLLRSSIDQLARGPSLSARLHQRVQLRDGEVLGVGVYRQEAIKDGGRFSLQVRTKPGSLQIVSDGNYIWRDVSVGETHRLTRIDLQEYARLVGFRGGPDGRHVGSKSLLPRHVTSLELGGVPQILQAIGQRYRFQPPRQDVLAGLEIYELRGELTSRGQTPPSAPPAQVPSHVTVSFGRDDLFPYRIVFEYAGAGRAEQQNGVPERLQIQFSEVSFGAKVDNRWFEYSPRDVAWRDITAEIAAGAGETGSGDTG